MVRWLKETSVLFFDAFLWGFLALLLYQLLLAPTGLRFVAQVKKLKEQQGQGLSHTLSNKHSYERNTKLLESDEEYFQREVRGNWLMIRPNDFILEHGEEG